MQTYIVRVYRACPEDEGSVAGVIEDIESGQKKSFNSFAKLQSMLADTIGMGQLELTEMVAEELTTLDPVAMAG
jgi:hypothetical protein